MALDQPRSAVPPKAHSEVVKSELRKIDDEEVYDSLCKSSYRKEVVLCIICKVIWFWIQY